jgi:hypothetical protein
MMMKIGVGMLNCEMLFDKILERKKKLEIMI